MEPLPVLMREYIRDHPGCDYNRIIGDVCDLYHASSTDADRILWVLCRTNKVVSVDDSRYDDEYAHYVYFIASELPEICPSASDDPLPCECPRLSLDERLVSFVKSCPGADIRTVVYSAVDFSEESYSDARDRIFALVDDKVLYFRSIYSVFTGDLEIYVYHIDYIPIAERTPFGMTVLYDHNVPEGF